MSNEWQASGTTVWVWPEEDTLQVRMDGDTVSCAGAVWQEALADTIAVSCMTAPPPPAPTLQQVLRVQAMEHHVVPINPEAALLKAIRAAGFAPTSDEFHVDYEGRHYIAQRAEHLLTGAVRIYYVVGGEWDNVMVVDGL